MAQNENFLAPLPIYSHWNYNRYREYKNTIGENKFSATNFSYHRHHLWLCIFITDDLKLATLKSLSKWRQSTFILKCISPYLIVLTSTFCSEQVSMNVIFFLVDKLIYHYFICAFISECIFPDCYLGESKRNSRLFTQRFNLYSVISTISTSDVMSQHRQHYFWSNFHI